MVHYVIIIHTIFFSACFFFDSGASYVSLPVVSSSDNFRLYGTIEK